MISGEELVLVGLIFGLKVLNCCVTNASIEAIDLRTCRCSCLFLHCLVAQPFYFFFLFGETVNIILDLVANFGHIMLIDVSLPVVVV